MDEKIQAWFAGLPLPIRAGLIALVAGPVLLVSLTDMTFGMLIDAWPKVLAGVVAAGAAGGGGWWYYQKTQREKQQAINAKIAQDGRAALVLPLRGEGESWRKTSQYAATFAAGIATLTRQMPDQHVSLEIIGTQEGTYLQVWAPDPQAHQGLTQNLLSSFPNLIQIRHPQAVVGRDDLLAGLASQTQWVTLGLAQDAAYPLRQIDDFNTESLPSILAALMRSARMGRMGIQFVLKAPDTGWKRKASRSAAQKRQALAEQRGSLRAKGDREELKRLEAKADALTGSACTVRVFAEPQSAGRLKRVLSAVTSVSRSRYNQLEAADKGQGAAPIEGRYFDYDARNVVLSAEELSPLWHVPVDNAGVVTARGVQIPPPAEAITVDRPPFSPNRRILGRGLMPSGERVFITWEHGFDTLVHSFFCGATGAGKSTQLLFLMLQDVCSGYGTILMEPHRDLTMEVIDKLPPERARDVVWINPTDPHIHTLPPNLGMEPWDLERAFGLNLLDYGDDPDRIQAVTGQFMAVLQMILGGESWDQMPRMKRILDNGITAVLEGVEGTPTLMHLLRMFRSEGYRDELLSRVRNPVVRDFWREDFAEWGQGRRNEAFGPVFNRIEPMVRRRMVRHIVAQKHTTLPILRMMDAGKIVLLDLSSKDERIGAANAQALGTMFATLVWSAAGSRVKHTYPVPTYFWIDEFHNYVTREFVKMLAEARGFGLGVNMASQYYGQVPKWMQEAILSNAWTKMASAIKSPDEARLLQRIFEVPVEQLLSLEAFTWVTRVSARHQTTDPFTTRALPPVKRASEVEPGEPYLDLDKLHKAFRVAGGGAMPRPEDRGGEPLDFFEGVGDLDAEDEAIWEKHREAMRGQGIAERAQYLADLSEDDWNRYRRIRQMMDKRWYREIAPAPEGFANRREWIRTMSALQVEVPRDEIEAERLRLAGETEEAAGMYDDVLFD